MLIYKYFFIIKLSLVFLLFSITINSEELSCDLETKFKFKDKEWESVANRIMNITIMDDRINMFNVTADQDWGSHIIFKDHNNYINAFKDQSTDSSWIKMLTFNKKNGFFKYFSTSNVGETILLGWCIRDY